MATFTSNSPVETEEIGRKLASDLRAGSILALQGDLGAGKTQFVKGIVAALGGGDVVTSPTFTLVHEYSGGRLPVYHFDFFRLEDERAAEALGLNEYFFGEGVSLVEWADRFPQLIPAESRWIRITSGAGDTRTIEIG